MKLHKFIPKSKMVYMSLLFLTSFSNAAISNQEITPTEVYQQTQHIQQKVIFLATLMGVSLKDVVKEFPSNVYPRDVFYQGLTVHKKISRLRYEFTHIEPQNYKTTDGEYHPKDAQKLMFSIHQILNDILSHIENSYKTDSINSLSIKGLLTSDLPQLEQGKHPKDVFVQLSRINKQLNQLLDFKFSPADSYERITLSISYASAVLQTISNKQTVFDPEPLQLGKTPTEVFNRLLQIDQKLYECLNSVGIKTIKIQYKQQTITRISPSNVYDLSVLILSNLSFLQRNLSKKFKPKPSYYPGKILPSVVYQRVSILEKQINEIHRLRNLLKMK